MWHTVFIKNEDFILYESEKAVKIKIPLKGAHYIWLPKKLVKFEKLGIKKVSSKCRQTNFRML